MPTLDTCGATVAPEEVCWTYYKYNVIHCWIFEIRQFVSDVSLSIASSGCFRNFYVVLELCGRQRNERLVSREAFCPVGYSGPSDYSGFGGYYEAGYDRRYRRDIGVNY
jgi:hypothetical protein